MKKLLLFSVATLAGQIANGQTVPSLINYQGRLTDQTGTPLTAGNYGVQFRLWDSNTNTTGLVWGQQQNVAVQTSGVFNVILGAPGGSAIPGATPDVNNLNFAFTATNRYLGVTVASSNGVALASPTEITPRQQLLSVPFAVSAATAGTAVSVVPGAIGALQIAAAGIQTSNLADGLVTLQKLAFRVVGTNVPVGGLARSLPVLQQTLTSTAFEDVPNLFVTIQTTGRPVLAFVVPSLLDNYTGSPGTSQPSGLYFVVSPGANVGLFRLVRDNGAGAIVTRFGSGAGGSQSVGYPDPMGPVMDLPPAGTHTYKLQWGFTASAGGGYATIYNSVLVVFEL